MQWLIVAYHIYIFVTFSVHIKLKMFRTVEHALTIAWTLKNIQDWHLRKSNMEAGEWENGVSWLDRNRTDLWDACRRNTQAKTAWRSCVLNLKFGLGVGRRGWAGGGRCTRVSHCFGWESVGPRATTQEMNGGGEMVVVRWRYRVRVGSGICNRQPSGPRGACCARGSPECRGIWWAVMSLQFLFKTRNTGAHFRCWFAENWKRNVAYSTNTSCQTRLKLSQNSSSGKKEEKIKMV